MCIKRVQITTVMCGLRPLLFSVLRLHVETCMGRDMRGRDMYGMERRVW